MDWLTAEDLISFVDFLGVCMIILCFSLGWIAGGFR